MENEGLKPWYKCTFMDVDTITYNKFINRKKEIVMKSPLTSPALIECLKDENLSPVKKERVINMELDRQCDFIIKKEEYESAYHQVFEYMLHDMTFLKEK